MVFEDVGGGEIDYSTSFEGDDSFGVFAFLKDEDYAFCCADYDLAGFGVELCVCCVEDVVAVFRWQGPRGFDAEVPLIDDNQRVSQVGRSIAWSTISSIHCTLIIPEELSVLKGYRADVQVVT